MPVHDGNPKSVAKALRESEERYRVLFDSIDEGFCIVEVLFDERGQPVDYRFLEMNPAFVAQTGLVHAQGRTVRELVPQHEKHWFEVYGRVALTGEPARFESEARHLNPPRWYDVYAFRYGSPEKRQVAVLFKDIGPRKRAEEALRETEGRYKDLIRQAPAGIYEVDFRRRRFVSVNEAMCELLGYSRDELLAMDPSSIMDEESRTRFQGRVRRWLSGEAPERNVEYRVRSKDGRFLDTVLNVNFTTGTDGQPLGATVVAHDITARKQAEEAVRRAHARFENVLGHLEDDFAVFDSQWRYVYLNEAVARHLGLPRDQLVGQNVWELLPQLAAAPASAQLKSVLTERRPRDWTEQSPVTGRWLEWRAFPWEDGVASLTRDVTERRQAEEDLNKATRRFQTIVDHAPIAIYVKDRAGRFVFGNRKLEQYSGRPLEQLLGKTDYDFAPKEVADRWRENDLRVLERQQVSEFEEAGTDRDGRPYVNLSVKFPLTDEAGTVVEICGVSTDITDRKRADEALRESEALLAEAQRIARLGSWEWDILSGRLTWSHETFGLLGYDPASTVPSYDLFLALVHPEDRSKVTGAVEDALSGRSHFDLDFRVLRPDQSVGWIHSAGEVTFDAGGHPAAMTGVVLDITERKQAEKALLEADRRKDEFIAILSHELRNPLAPIRYALPLLSEERLGEAARRAVAVIDRQAAHLTRLVDDLLDVSRITAGKIELRRDHVALAAVVSAAVEAASPAIAAGRHSFDIAVPEDPVWLHVDAARIAQAITNLLNNSAKYTPQGGRIRLEATSAENLAVIRVTDNGTGIAPEALTTVFEMFRQAGSPKRTQGGLGVGLTLAKQFVEMHGGTIEAHSAGENTGAEVVIRLPLAPAAVPRDEQQEPRAAGQPACLRVLVVDDNVDLVDMLALVVEAAGHDVRKAFDGRSAISAALEYQPHAILLDVGMPGMNGFEIATELRRHPQMARTRIVALTGWGQAEDRRRTAQAGFDDHLTKPTDPQQIQRILREVAQRITA